MGRRRKAWLVNGDGRRPRRPGCYVQWSNFGTGRRVVKTRKFDTLKAGQTWVRRYNARADLDALGETVPVSMRDAAVEFIDSCSALAKDTRTHYHGAIAFLTAIVGTDSLVSNVTGRHVDALVRARSRKTARSTVSKHVRSLHVFFNWCMGQRYIDHNPVDGAKSAPRRSTSRERPPVDEAGLNRLVSELDTEDRCVAVWIAMTTGMDRKGITRLTSSHIDIEQACFRIVRGKTRKMTTLPIHPALIPLLVSRLDRTQHGQPLLSGLARQADDRDWWKLATKRAGLDGVLFRDLRAVAASRLQTIGRATLSQAQHLLGHASPTTTAAHYQVPDPGIRRALDSLTIPGLQSPEEPTQDPPES